MQEVLVTPGAFFEGYVSTEYGEPIWVEEVVPIEATYISRVDVGNSAESLKSCFSRGRKAATNSLINKAKESGYNGIIDFKCSYVPFEPTTAGLANNRILAKYVVCIIAEGTPVKLLKQQSRQ